MVGKWIYGCLQIGQRDSHSPLMEWWTHQKQDMWPQAARKWYNLLKSISISKFIPLKPLVNPYTALLACTKVPCNIRVNSICKVSIQNKTSNKQIQE